MKIWIDADACPLPVKEVIFRAARRLNVETVLVANQSMALPLNAPMVRLVTVREGANMADRYIVEHATQGDLVITADIPLAGQLVEGRVVTIDPRGEVYTPDNIASRLAVRNFLDDLRGAGQTLSGNKPYNDQDKLAFANALDRHLTRALREAQRLQRPPEGAAGDSASPENTPE